MYRYSHKFYTNFASICCFSSLLLKNYYTKYNFQLVPVLGIYKFCIITGITYIFKTKHCVTDTVRLGTVNSTNKILNEI
jgi:hypothetical protein